MIVISRPQQIIPARDPKQCREAKRYCTLSVMIKNYGEPHDEKLMAMMMRMLRMKMTTKIRMKRMLMIMMMMALMMRGTGGEEDDDDNDDDEKKDADEHKEHG